MVRSRRITVPIDIPTGVENPARGTYLRVIEPKIGQELLIGVRELEPEIDPVFPENPTQRQVHLVGTPHALEELGKYLIALARLETADPESYGSFDDVRDMDGGTIRLLPRRMTHLPDFY